MEAIDELEDLGKDVHEDKPVLVKTKSKPVKEKELPEHIRKAIITINDKDKNNPIVIEFQGEWVISDINLAGKYLILDFYAYVRDRAMMGR